VAGSTHSSQLFASGGQPHAASHSCMPRRSALAFALADVADGVLSPLEYRYVRNVERAHGLPTAKRQVLIVRGGQRQYLDNLYQAFGLGVELDGQAYHPR
jgi:hypothetical protein